MEADESLACIIQENKVLVVPRGNGLGLPGGRGTNIGAMARVQAGFTEPLSFRVSVRLPMGGKLLRIDVYHGFAGRDWTPSSPGVFVDVAEYLRSDNPHALIVQGMGAYQPPEIGSEYSTLRLRQFGGERAFHLGPAR